MSEQTDQATKDTQDDVADAPSQQEVLVNGWRFEQFTALGFDLTHAASLVYSAVDLNVARRLIGAGCAPPLAASILL